jgi:hypothetical protein
LQRVDWNIKSYQIADASVCQYWATPEFGDRPRDIRARPFSLLFTETLLSSIEAGLIKNDEVIFRARLYCSGACRRDLAAEEALKEQGVSVRRSESETFILLILTIVLKISKAKQRTKKVKKRKRRVAGSVTLMPPEHASQN